MYASVKLYVDDRTPVTCYFKSPSPINFVKILLSNFLGNEFLVKMYKLNKITL